MPWVYKQKKPRKHDCKTPGARGTQDRMPGDIWQCRQCMDTWTLVKPGVPDPHWTDTEPEWERRRGEDNGVQ